MRNVVVAAVFMSTLLLVPGIGEAALENSAPALSRPDKQGSSFSLMQCNGNYFGPLFSEGEMHWVLSSFYCTTARNRSEMWIAPAPGNDSIDVFREWKGCEEKNKELVVCSMYP